MANRISIECVDNAVGFPGVVVYGDKTYPIFSQQIASLNVVMNNTLPQQGTAFGAGHRAHSSVRTFQFPEREDEETPMECDPPETKSYSNGSNGAPPESDDDMSL